MLTSLLFLGVLFVPGLLISGIAGIREYRYLISVCLSYFSFVLLVTLARELSLSAAGLLMLYLAFTVLLTGVALFAWKKRGYFIQARNQWNTIFSATLAPSTVGAVFLGGCLYHLAFGIYDEVPADLYQHLNFAHEAFVDVSTREFRGKFTDILNLHRGGGFWYVLVAWVSHMTGMELIETFPYIMVASAIIFMVGVAVCADRIFRIFAFPHRHHQLAVLLTVFFVFAQMGINVFSFIRYYSYAPTMINFVVFFAALVCLLNVFEKTDSMIQSALVFSIAVTVTSLVHLQEGLFALGFCVLLIFWKCAEIIWLKRRQRLGAIILPVTTFVVTGLVCLGIFLWVRLNYDVTPYYHHKVIPFSLPLLGQLYVIDPGYQPFRVITIWGLLVYALFIVNIRYYCKQPLLVVGMVSPFLTLLNPLFTDIFMRLGNSGTLWRMSYMIPIHFVAGSLFILLIGQFKRKSIATKAASLASMGLMFLLLLPSLFFIPLNTYAKTTLGKVRTENSLTYWRDLIEYLGTQKNPRRILTDPVTGYLIDALTPHRAHQYKFLPNSSYYHFTFVFDSYDEFPLQKYSGKMLVVNTRDGAQSPTGQLSGHWNKDVLSVSEYYPEKLKLHLEAYPDKFEKLWSSGGINVYEIK